VTVTITAVPLVSLILASFRNRGHWTFAGWNVLIGRQRVVGLDIDLVATVGRSLVFAGIATMVAVPIGLLAVHASRNSGGMERIMMIPLGTSAVAVALGILITYDVSPIDFRASWWLIPLVHSVVALPFVVRTISPVRSRIPDDLRLAAATLGASPVRTWFTVDRPLLMTAIRTAAGLSAALSIGEFGATSLMSRRNTDTLPVAVERLLSRTGDLARLSGQSAAVVLLAVAIAALLVGRFDDPGSPGMGARS
jgi:thiamine transport system permease protein